jgi:hypothetical protein
MYADVIFLPSLLLILPLYTMSASAKIYIVLPISLILHIQELIVDLTAF